VAGGGGDDAAAAVGIGVFEAGLVSSSIGTSGVLFAHADEFEPDPSGRLNVFCHSVPGAYHLMGVTNSAGDSLSWWRGIFGEETSFDELVEAASEAPPCSEGSSSCRTSPASARRTTIRMCTARSSGSGAATAPGTCRAP
jgi:xylulokinase